MNKLIYKLLIILFFCYKSFGAVDKQPDPLSYLALTFNCENVENINKKIQEICTELKIVEGQSIVEKIAHLKQEKGSADPTLWLEWKKYEASSAHTSTILEERLKSLHLSFFQSYKTESIQTLQNLGFTKKNLPLNILAPLTKDLSSNFYYNVLSFERGSLFLKPTEESEKKLKDIFKRYQDYFVLKTESIILQMPQEKESLAVNSLVENGFQNVETVLGMIQEEDLSLNIDNGQWNLNQKKIFWLFSILKNKNIYYQYTPIIRERLRKSIYQNDVNLFTSLFSREIFNPHITIFQRSNLDKLDGFQAILTYPIPLSFKEIVFVRNNVESIHPIRRPLLTLSSSRQNSRSVSLSRTNSCEAEQPLISENFSPKRIIVKHTRSDDDQNEQTSTSPNSLTDGTSSSDDGDRILKKHRTECN